MSRADQLKTYFLKFLEFTDSFLEMAGASSKKVKETLEVLRQAPTVMVCGMAQTLIEKYGGDLSAHDMTGVFKILGDYSDAITAQGLAETSLKAIGYLETHPDIKEKFFKYVDVIIKIMG